MTSSYTVCHYSPQGNVIGHEKENWQPKRDGEYLRGNHCRYYVERNRIRYQTKSCIEYKKMSSTVFVAPSSKLGRSQI